MLQPSLENEIKELVEKIKGNAESEAEYLDACDAYYAAMMEAFNKEHGLWYDIYGQEPYPHDPEL